MNGPQRSQRWAVTPVVGAVAGLALGVGLGAVLHAHPDGVLRPVAPVLEVAGSLWLNALWMIVLPLTVANLIVAITSNGDSRRTGRISGGALVLFVASLLLAAGFALLVATPIVHALREDPQFAATVSKGLASQSRQLVANEPPAPSASQWLVSLVPRNPLKTALDEDLLPLLVATALFGLALNRTREGAGAAVIRLVQGLAQTMLVLVGWIVRLAPMAVFSLGFTFAASTGFEVAGVLGEFVLLVCGVMLAFTTVLYPLASWLGRVPVRRFAAAVLPAQIIAVSTRSSIAALPALLEGAEQWLGMDATVARTALPLAVSVFKVNRPISATVKLLFLAHLFGVPLSPARIATFVVTVLLVSFTTLGVPNGGGGFRTVPAYLAAGMPIEGIVLLAAVDSIQDVVRTVLNVTGDLGVATILARLSGAAASAQPAGELSA